MKPEYSNRIKRIMFILAIIGPGIITATVDNDAGGIATYSVAGADFGYSLLWTLIPITVLLIIVQEMCSRMGAVTGKGLADLIRENFGLKVTFFIMIGLIIANLFITTSEFAGIAAAGEMFGISRYILIPLSAIFVLYLIFRLNYKSMEKFFFTLILFYIAYIISGIMAKPDWGQVLRKTVVPTFSLDPSYLYLLIAVIGTTITPWMQFYLQSSIVEKGIRVKEYVYSKWDVIIGCIITDTVSFFMIVTCGALLFAKQIKIESAIDAATALVPVAGTYASTLFALGLLGAALFAAFILPLSTAFYVCEAFGWESGVNKKYSDAKQFYILIISLVIIGAGIILFPFFDLIKLMIVAQVINGVLLPFILIFILLIINDKNIMGEHVNHWIYNIITWAGCLLVMALSIFLVVKTFF